MSERLHPMCCGKHYTGKPGLHCNLPTQKGGNCCEHGSQEPDSEGWVTLTVVTEFRVKESTQIATDVNRLAYILPEAIVATGDIEDVEIDTLSVEIINTDGTTVRRTLEIDRP